jgi:microcin C transport system ATP-binding protein
VQVQIVDLLLKLQAEHELAYLFISHDLKIVRALSDQLIVLRNGVVVEQGEADRVFGAPEDPYTRALISAAFEFELEDESILEQ